MDVRAVRYAVTLAEELHFGRAAAAHYIAAQPFGRRIQELEREVGARLFDRTSRRVTLTAAGERFLPRARTTLTHIDALAATTRRPTGDVTGNTGLRVGVVGYGLADRWSATRTLVARSRPGLTLAYVELDWVNQYDAIRTGEVDVAVVHHVGDADDLFVEELTANDRYVIVPVESDLADADRLSDNDIMDRPWITPVGQPGLAAWAGPGETDPTVSVRSPPGCPRPWPPPDGSPSTPNRPAGSSRTQACATYRSRVRRRWLRWRGRGGRATAVDAFRAAAHGSAHLDALCTAHE